MDTYGTHSPSEYADARKAEIRSVSFDDLGGKFHHEPLLVTGFDKLGFHRFPEEKEIVPFLLNALGNQNVPVSDGGDVTLSDWYKNKHGRYLKDWHINKVARESGLDAFFVTPPKLKDWLNEFYLSHPSQRLDFQFLYWGDSGSSTGYHEDVAGTFSWSFNLRGRKGWSFYMRDLRGQPYLIQCVQKAGELIFVPSGCFHSVENLENDTVSINQNWFNQHNLNEVVRRIMADSREASRRFDMFQINFASEEDRMDQLESVTRSNNDINAGMLLEVVKHKLSECDSNVDSLQNIQDALLQFHDAPQFRLIEHTLNDLLQYFTKKQDS
jgi:hypothetical protein